MVTARPGESSDQFRSVTGYYAGGDDAGRCWRTTRAIASSANPKDAMNSPGEDVFVANATSTTEITNAETRKIRLRVLMEGGIDHDSLRLDDPPYPQTEDRVTDQRVNARLGHSAEDLAGVLTLRRSHRLGYEKRPVLSLDRVTDLGEPR